MHRRETATTPTENDADKEYRKLTATLGVSSDHLVLSRPTFMSASPKPVEAHLVRLEYTNQPRLFLPTGLQ